MEAAMLDRIRVRRQESLVASRQARTGRFNPFRIGPILGVDCIDGVTADRVNVVLHLGEGISHELRHFYRAHASHLMRLTPADRTGYLRDIWLNYSRGLIATSALEKVAL